MATQNWRSSFCPGLSGNISGHAACRCREADCHIRNPRWTREKQRAELDLVQELNAQYAATRPGDAALEARIQSFELAYRMQREATDAFDLQQETEATQNAYGKGTHGRQLLLTRRLIERGVRFIPNLEWCRSTVGQPRQPRKTAQGSCSGWDGPIAAFLADLKQRGLFDSTLILWGGEFGRTPVAEFPSSAAAITIIRLHLMAGRWRHQRGTGLRCDDECGFRAVDKTVHAMICMPRC